MQVDLHTHTNTTCQAQSSLSVAPVHVCLGLFKVEKPTNDLIPGADCFFFSQ